MKKVIILVYALCAYTSAIYTQERVIIEPVVDMSVSYPGPLNEPAAPQHRSCRRAHQGLFNEIVAHTETKNGFAKISYQGSVVYGVDGNGQPLSEFWITDHQSVALEDLSEQMKDALVTDKTDTIVLTLPWQGFSVGTHFKRSAHVDTDSSYAVSIPDFTRMTVRTGYVPHTHGMVWHKRSAREGRALFLKILKRLLAHAQQQDKVIPYVWGGSSYVTAHDPHDTLYTFGAWERAKQLPLYTGYDCSELIMRVAHIAGIDFPWKLSGMIRNHCVPVSSDHPLENGDIIWIQGHVMVVSDSAHDEVIEARGYKSGYGKIHRITLPRLFKDIKTYDDLLKAYNQQAPITLLDNTGKPVRTYDNCMLLKLVTE